MDTNTVESQESRAESHTPGPWSACGHDRGGCQCCMVWSIPADCVVAVALTAKDKQYTGGEGIGQLEIAQANARLIAAAPELLAACEEAIGDANDGESRLGNYLAMATAIVKARGTK